MGEVIRLRNTPPCMHFISNSTDMSLKEIMKILKKGVNYKYHWLLRASPGRFWAGLLPRDYGIRCKTICELRKKLIQYEKLQKELHEIYIEKASPVNQTNFSFLDWED